MSDKKFPVSGEPIPAIDLRQVSVAEWRAMFDRTQTDGEGDATLAKATGMTVEAVQALKLYDYRALFAAVVEFASKPLDPTDPKN